MTELKVVLDTNVWLNNPESLVEYDEVIVPVAVLHELNKLKIESGEKGFKARKAVRIMYEAKNITIDYPMRNFSVTDYIFDKLGESNDTRIIESASRHKCKLVTSDSIMAIMAKSVAVEVDFKTTKAQVDKSDCDYTGVREVHINTHDDEVNLASFYETKSENVFGFDLYDNEYLMIWQDGQVIDRYKKSGSELVKVKYEKLTSKQYGKIEPKNERQKLLFNLLQSEKITVKFCQGGFGTGKDFCMINHALKLIKEGKFDKLIWVRNNIEVKDSNAIGFLPSDMNSKLLPFAFPISDHIGGIDGLNQMLDKEIELCHLGFIRGRDIKNSIIYVTECENNTKEHIQLLLGRVGEGSQIWLNGDTKQVDSVKFEVNSGIAALKMLRGNKLYGQVTLDKTERSETASLAYLLD